MELNPEIKGILRDCKIDVSEGTLVLLAIYFDLDADKVCSEDSIKAINTTGIVEKNYADNTIQWNVSLFKGEEVAFDWVANWLEPFGTMNPDRKGSVRDCKTRMMDFFRKYPEYRKDDVYIARDMYLATIREPKYLMKSHKFIFDGVGALKKSTLLEFCEKASTRKSTEEGYQRGKVVK